MNTSLKLRHYWPDTNQKREFSNFIASHVQQNKKKGRFRDLLSTSYSRIQTTPLLRIFSVLMCGVWILFFYFSSYYSHPYWTVPARPNLTITPLTAHFLKFWKDMKLKILDTTEVLNKISWNIFNYGISHDDRFFCKFFLVYAKMHLLFSDCLTRKNLIGAIRITIV